VKRSILTAILIYLLSACGLLQNNTALPFGPGVSATEPGIVATEPATVTTEPAPSTPATPAPSTPSTPSTPAPAEPVKTEKIYRTYLEKDTAMLNAHDDVNTQVETPLSWTGAKLWRDVPSEDGLSHHHVGDLATDLPVLVETVADFAYTKWVSEVQADGTSKYVPTEATGTKTVWEWTIRDDATWANGEKITAANINTLADKTIVIDAFAHQSDNTTEDVADAAAIAHFGVTAV
jgi:ABC-type transport system substrate-binding protein